ncbi:MAG: phenylacetic acid degradation operon negative regulatory protein [Paracoccaceae bacterium]
MIVTLFGDLAQNKSDQISGALLSLLTECIGIKPEAMRVALHRLRKDGWIVSEKSGRNSHHRLSEFGFRETLAARPKIYASHVPSPENWHIRIAQPMSQKSRLIEDQTHISQGYLIVGQGVYLGQGHPEPGDPNFLTLNGNLETIPNWLRESLADDMIFDGYTTLLTDLDALSGAVESVGQLSPLETAALRILIIHSWRRLLLRHATLPPKFFPDDWPGTLCRTRVIALLDRLKRPVLSELQT